MSLSFYEEIGRVGCVTRMLRGNCCRGIYVLLSTEVRLLKVKVGIVVKRDIVVCVHKRRVDVQTI